MNPIKLIGMTYRLGANPKKHGQADCLSLTSAVLRWYDFEVPEPERSWYRRLRRNDYAVFKEELEKRCVKVESPRLGVVALCSADKGYGLAVYYEEGWLSFVESAVKWSPIGALQVVDLYCPPRRNSAT